MKTQGTHNMTTAKLSTTKPHAYSTGWIVYFFFAGICIRIVCIIISYQIHLTLFLRAASLTLGSSYGCCNANEVTKRNVDNINRYQTTNLTLNMPSYLGLTRSISWLLMPWLLASPGHQQPCKIRKSWSYTRKDFNYLWRFSVEEWHKM